MTIKELRDFLEANFSNEYKTISELAKPMNITDNREAYNFDAIKNHYCRRQKLESADALALSSDTVYLIEFKSGFARQGMDPKLEKAKKDGQRCSIRLKACESELLLEKVLCDGAAEFKKVFISVIDCSDTKGAMEDVILKMAGGKLGNESVSEKSKLEHDLKENSLLVYRKEIDKKHILYDEVWVMYDFEYSEKARKR
ncbi:hypothetical protein [Butyrivibrio sp. MB2005]|uniref:hypothetical protein n=1 Tax=Butyrivibrio sp. MB2005 TaxID=1280678 RepID=UPI00041293D5|nr:hypothetical protein [Butyrivibrio sp. MB2005]